MPIRVDPDEPRPTHHIELRYNDLRLGLILCDGNGNANPRAMQRSPYPTSALKIYQGEATYSDTEPPFTPVAQRDWSGGMGNENFDMAATRFRISHHLNTTKSGEVILGGLETPTWVDSGNILWPSKTTGGYILQELDLYGNNRFHAARFQAGATYDVLYILLALRKSGTPGNLIVEICDDNSGIPGAVIQSATFQAAKIEDGIIGLNMVKITAASLTASTLYWIKVKGYVGDNDDNHWTVMVNYFGGLASSAYLTSSDEISWIGQKYGLMYAINQGTYDHVLSKLFQYKNALYLVTQNGHIYVNGEQGVASGGTTSTLTVSGTPWTNYNWTNCICVLIAGTGSVGVLNWSKILSNTDNELTFEWTLPSAPDSTTEFVILGSNIWTEVSGTGQPTSVWDVCVWNGQVYFATGDGTDIVRMRRYNNSGVWTTVFTAETDHRGSHVIVQPDGNDAVIWYGKRTNQVYHTPAVAEGSALAAYDVANLMNIGQSYDRITGLQVYGEDSSMWVMKEYSIYEIKYASSTYTAYKFKLDEIGSAGDFRSGMAHLQHNVYLYFSLQDTLQRYYNNQLDSVGPDLDAGMPSNYSAPINVLAGYPGMIVAALSPFGTLTGNEDQHVTILASKGLGWHNLWSADKGEYTAYKTRSMNIQVLPGDHVDRLWFTWGPLVMWIPMALDPYNLPSSANPYLFRWEGHMITAWYYIQQQDTVKFWDSLKLATENLYENANPATGGSQLITVDYQTEGDAEGTWHEIGTFNTSLFQEMNLSENENVSARRLRLRIKLQTTDVRESPKLLATVIEAVTRVLVKYQNNLTFRLIDNDTDLTGERDDLTGAQKAELLREWAEQAIPVKVYSLAREFHNKTVLVEPASFRIISLTPLSEDSVEANLCQITLLEV